MDQVQSELNSIHRTSMKTLYATNIYALCYWLKPPLWQNINNSQCLMFSYISWNTDDKSHWSVSAKFFTPSRYVTIRGRSLVKSHVCCITNNQQIQNNSVHWHLLLHRNTSSQNINNTVNRLVCLMQGRFIGLIEHCIWISAEYRISVST